MGKVRVMLCSLMMLVTSNIMFGQDTLRRKNNDMKDFLDHIGQRESGNRYGIVSKSGYLGKYQFHPNTLKSIGMNVSKKSFLNSKELQDSAMVSLLKQNREILKKEISKINHKVIKGKPVTESGFLAAAHLVGYGKVLKYLKTGIDSCDGNGVKLTSYLFRFSGFNLKLDDILQ